MEGPTLETLDYTIRIGSTPTFLYFDLYLNTAYAAHYVYFTYILSSSLLSGGFSVIDYIKYLSYLLSLTIYIYRVSPCIIFLTIKPKPPCELCLWEETREPAFLQKWISHDKLHTHFSRVHSSKTIHQLNLKFSVNVPAMVLCLKPLTNC